MPEERTENFARGTNGFICVGGMPPTLLKALAQMPVKSLTLVGNAPALGIEAQKTAARPNIFSLCKVARYIHLQNSDTIEILNCRILS
jgi:hypothetical protein